MSNNGGGMLGWIGFESDSDGYDGGDFEGSDRRAPRDDNGDGYGDYADAVGQGQSDDAREHVESAIEDFFARVPDAARVEIETSLDEQDNERGGVDQSFRAAVRVVYADGSEDAEDEDVTGAAQRWAGHAEDLRAALHADDVSLCCPVEGLSAMERGGALGEVRS